MKNLFILLIFSCGGLQADFIHIKTPGAFKTEEGKQCKKAYDYATNACQSSYSVKGQIENQQTQALQAASGRGAAPTSGSYVQSIQLANGMTKQVTGTCRAAYEIYTDNCQKANESLQSKLKSGDPSTQKMAANDLKELKKIEESGQRFFSGTANQLNNQNAAEAQALQGGTNTHTEATGDATSNANAQNTNVGQNSPQAQSPCRPGGSEEECTIHLNKTYNNQGSTMANQPVVNPVSAPSSNSAANPAANSNPNPSAATNPSAAADGPKTLEDCRSGSPSGFSGTSQCTDFLNKHYLELSNMRIRGPAASPNPAVPPTAPAKKPSTPRIPSLTNF